MACGETSFNSYTFTYQWTVNNLEVRLSNPSELTSPVFSSPPGTQPATKWTLAVFKDDENHSMPLLQTLVPARVDKPCLSVELQRLLNTKSTPISTIASPFTSGGLTGAPKFQFSQLKPVQTSALPQNLVVRKQNPDDEDIWVEANLKLPTIVAEKKSKFHAIPGATYTSKGPTKLPGSSNRSTGFFVSPAPIVISFQRFLPISKLCGSQSVTFECEIKVWSLDKPIHVTKELKPSPNSINRSDFDLSKCMEEARQNSLFTDVTLVVADRKEFKAHKVVLASQSQFFKTRFASRWMDPRLPGYSDDRVEMTDVPASVMEAILSYMYTGKVTDIGKIAFKLLPVADEYGLVGLRKMCEGALVRLLTSNTVIIILICAATHNAPDLKKACMEFISSNTVSVRQSEWWGKLKETQIYRDLWMELLEFIATAK